MRDLFSAGEGVERACQVGHSVLLEFLQSESTAAVRAHDHVVEFVKWEPRRRCVGSRFGSAGTVVPNMNRGTSLKAIVKARKGLYRSERVRLWKALRF